MKNTIRRFLANIVAAELDRALYESDQRARNHTDLLRGVQADILLLRKEIDGFHTAVQERVGPTADEIRDIVHQELVPLHECVHTARIAIGTLKAHIAAARQQSTEEYEQLLRWPTEHLVPADDPAADLPVGLLPTQTSPGHDPGAGGAVTGDADAAEKEAQ